MTNPHYHKIINCGVVLSGTLAIVCRNGSCHDFQAGEPLMETDGEILHVENRGKEYAAVLMFYADCGDVPLSIPAE